MSPRAQKLLTQDHVTQLWAAGASIHPQRITCVSIHPAYCEVEHLRNRAVDRTGSSVLNSEIDVL
jgi:hypothetical protein